MSQEAMGRLYLDGETVVTMGEEGTCMFQIQKGTLEVVVDGQVINTLAHGEFFGEMSLFNQAPRSATIRSKGESRVMTIDQSAFLRRLQEDPMLGFRILKVLHQRMRQMNQQGVGYEGYLSSSRPVAHGETP
ncbi:MAG: cyclic nucleotide-binding domain-containing protein [Magnetococcales bacterium]|nr:cyclic nucleotide-binding domain-containing protein [Magnetococcales bacterium]NGZ26281.1 cyclic nucleotide-binding domain-containing protein [Magnetococcales bacterium]